MFLSSGSGCLISVFILLLAIHQIVGKYPYNFPSSMTLTEYNFTNWAGYSTVCGVWVAYPKTDGDILDAINWARTEGFRVRASGFQHSWLPNTVTPDDTSDSKDGTSPIILLKTNRYLTKMAVISRQYGRSSFWAQPGIQLSELTKNLARRNLGFANMVDIDEPTLGGVISIAGHGTSFARRGQKTTLGHTHGTMSNLIMSFTAVVFDRRSNKYVLKTFHRSDPEAKYFLTSLGRTFFTNVTMRVGPLLHYRLKSQMDISATQLFRRPSKKDDQKGPTLQEMVDKSDGLTVTVFPYSDTVLARSYTIEPTRPQGSRFVDKPAHFPADDADVATVLGILDKIKAGDESQAVKLGRALVTAANRSLTLNDGWDIWGSAPMVHATSVAGIVPIKVSNHAVLTTRNRVQEIAAKIYRHFLRVRNHWQEKGNYPFTGTLDIWVGGLDHPGDSLIDGAESPAISFASVNELKRRTADVIVYTSIRRMIGTSKTYQALSMFEEFRNGNESLFDIVRPEWVTEWSIDETGPWKIGAAPNILESFSRGDVDYLKETARTLNRYDPFHVLSNSFLDDFLH